MVVACVAVLGLAACSGNTEETQKEAVPAAAEKAPAAQIEPAQAPEMAAETAPAETPATPAE